MLVNIQGIGYNLTDPEIATTDDVQDNENHLLFCAGLASFFSRAMYAVHFATCLVLQKKRNFRQVSLYVYTVIVNYSVSF